VALSGDQVFRIELAARWPLSGHRSAEGRPWNDLAIEQVIRCPEGTGVRWPGMQAIEH
jgi:hypothetical protein